MSERKRYAYAHQRRWCKDVQSQTWIKPGSLSTSLNASSPGTAETPKPTEVQRPRVALICHRLSFQPWRPPSSIAWSNLQYSWVPLSTDVPHCTPKNDGFPQSSGMLGGTTMNKSRCYLEMLENVQKIRLRRYSFLQKVRSFLAP